MKEILKKIRGIFLPLIGVIIARKRFRNKSYFLCNRGMGDTVIFLSRLKEYKKINPENEINIIIQENQSTIANGYKDLLNSICVIKKESMWCLYRAALYGWLPTNIKYIIPENGFAKLGIKNCSIVDLIGETLGLGENKYKYDSPQFSWSKERKEQVLKETKAIKDQTIILSPYAFSVPEIEMKIWERIAAFYKKNGFHVVTNQQNSSECPIKGTVAVSLPLDEMYLFAEYCGTFIGLRSGLCDLLAFSRCKMVVFYPAQSNIDWKEKFTFKNLYLKKEIEEVREDEFEVWLAELERK